MGYACTPSKKERAAIAARIRREHKDDPERGRFLIDNLQRCWEQADAEVCVTCGETISGRAYYCVENDRVEHAACAIDRAEKERDHG